MFSKALEFVLRWEGGYVNHPNDPGGETNQGVTKAVYDAYRKTKKLPVQSVKLISKEEVLDIYKFQYWTPAGCQELDEKNPKLAISVMDFAVNAGVGRAKRYLGLVPEKDYKKYNDLRAKYYYSISDKNPKLKVFLKGWLNRLNDLKKFVETA